MGWGLVLVLGDGAIAVVCRVTLVGNPTGRGQAQGPHIHTTPHLVPTHLLIAAAREEPPMKHPRHTAPCPYAHQAVVCCETLIWFLTFAPHRTLSLRTWHVWVVKWVPMGTGMACLCPGRQILPT